MSCGFARGVQVWLSKAVEEWLANWTGAAAMELIVKGSHEFKAVNLRPKIVEGGEGDRTGVVSGRRPRKGLFGNSKWS